jgi:Type I phosphodiesterase / nucleotide pyrophosphatase.|nr:MAG: type I phosphodiesterase / nucleotide pyrophosphatase [Candidatus Nanosalinarum sp. J07AB56]
MSEFEDVLIVSDHGFTHVDRMFYTNVFLKEHGYLSESSSRGTGASSLQNTIKSTLAPLAETSLRPALKLANDILRSKTSVDFSPRSFEASAVDFQNTEAFSYRGGANNYGEITINDSRFEEGTVSDRKEKAQEVASDLREEDLVENVWLREQLYEEPEGMPDIVFKVVDEVGVGVSLFSKKEFKTDAFVHSEMGILAARGPSFGSAPEDARLEDVAPTVAHYIGQELECDGERMEIFSEDFSPENIAGSDVSGLDV